MVSSLTITPPKHKNKKEIILKSIFKILKENKLLTLSTTNKSQPYSCSLYYVFDKQLNLYIWTDKDSTHSENIKNNSKIAINIADTSQKWGSKLKGLQIQGTANIISTKELPNIARLYIKRFPKVSKYIKKIKDFVSGKLESQIYKFKINKIKLLDEKTFGKEEFIEILIKKN